MCQIQSLRYFVGSLFMYTYLMHSLLALRYVHILLCGALLRTSFLWFLHPCIYLKAEIFCIDKLFLGILSLKFVFTNLWTLWKQVSFLWLDKGNNLILCCKQNRQDLPFMGHVEQYNSLRLSSLKMHSSHHCGDRYLLCNCAITSPAFVGEVLAVLQWLVNTDCLTHQHDTL